MRRRVWPRLIPILALAGAVSVLSWGLQDRLMQPVDGTAMAKSHPRSGPPPTAVDVAPEVGTSADLAGAAAVPPSVNFQDVVDRNLFAHDRRPPLDAKETVVTAPARLPDLVLVGIVVGAGLRTAIFRDLDAERRVTLRPGDRHQGWQLAKIGPRTVWLQREGRNVELSLNHARPDAARLNAARPVAGIPADAGNGPIPQRVPARAPD